MKWHTIALLHILCRSACFHRSFGQPQLRGGKVDTDPEESSLANPIDLFSQDPFTYGPSKPVAPIAKESNRSLNIFGDTCGLVKTTSDDDDWLIATSDRILRLSLCVASPPCASTAWYDTPFNPCYSENRYWKFQDGVGTAFAYPLAAMGVGSFDSLYVRRNVKLQFYQGTGDANPFGPELVGPKYVSITHWRDIACDGFEPGTFFVDGGQGALDGYSLKIGGSDLESIKKLDVKEEDNEKDHHTDHYKDRWLYPSDNRFVLRRASSFIVELTLSNEFGPSCHEVYFEARHDFDGSSTVIKIPEFESTVPESDWGAERVKVTSNWWGNRKIVQMKINLPPNAPVGEYEFKALVKNRVETTSLAEEPFPDKVFLLFNPWSQSDSVYLDSATAREEYVMNENGLIWRSISGPSTWRYDQFGIETFDVLMHLLEGQPSSIRSNAKLVSRHLTKMLNEDDGDSGVLEGRWGNNRSVYAGGEFPWYWSGSDQIFKTYKKNGWKPVKFGQCWVYGGLLTSHLRAVGIPARTLTNFNSAHDFSKPLDFIIDRYYRINNNGEREWYKGDKNWNFHVWNDAWISNEWHAVDATAQERSDGVFRLGPAPHSAIKAKTGGLYDVDFVVAEVDSSVRDWIDKIDPITGENKPVVFDTSNTLIGQHISTKSVGSDTRSDITAAYKTPEVVRLLQPPQPVAVTFSAPSGVRAGMDIPLNVTLSNSVSNLTARIFITSSAISYEGTILGSLDSKEVTAGLPAGESLTVSLLISPSAYMDWIGTTNIIESMYIVEVEENDFLTGKISQTVVEFPPPVLNIVPSGPMAIGTNGSFSIEFDNPFDRAIQDAIVVFSVGRGLIQGDGNDVEVAVGTIAANDKLTVSQDFSVLSEGVFGVTATVLGDKASHVFADGFVTTFSDCNGNGMADADDISGGSSADCNNNDIPDECEADCNENGVPDDCDLVNDPSLDCNGNDIPDSCDITSGFSQDKNSNGVPDECDTDCNENGVPDDLDISAGTSSDFNGNGIPDECDVDCNSNGINDEIDISDGTSLDVNLNGVPDECEINLQSTTPMTSSSTTTGETSTTTVGATSTSTSTEPGTTSTLTTTGETSSSTSTTSEPGTTSTTSDEGAILGTSTTPVQTTTSEEAALVKLCRPLQKKKCIQEIFCMWMTTGNDSNRCVPSGANADHKIRCRKYNGSTQGDCEAPEHQGKCIWTGDSSKVCIYFDRNRRGFLMKRKMTRRKGGTSTRGGIGRKGGKSTGGSGMARGSSGMSMRRMKARKSMSM